MNLEQTGKYKDWVNVHAVGWWKTNVCQLDYVEEWKNLPYPKTDALLMAYQELPQNVMNAKRRELKSLISNDVFKVVLFENQVTISCW